MNFKNTVRDGYNTIADRYLAERTRDSEDIRLLDELMRRLPAGAAILDAGCGAGIPISEVLSERFQVTGVDFSEAQIELARKNVPNATFICEDMTRLHVRRRPSMELSLITRLFTSRARSTSRCSLASIECSSRAA
jgi:SAM-dependent methyltransferase